MKRRHSHGDITAGDIGGTEPLGETIEDPNLKRDLLLVSGAIQREEGCGPQERNEALIASAIAVNEDNAKLELL